MNEDFSVIAAGGLPQKFPVPQCGTKSREKQPPSNPTKTAIDPKTIRTGESPRSGWLILITARQIPPAVQTAACRPAAGRLRKNAWCRSRRASQTPSEPKNPPDPDVPLPQKCPVPQYGTKSREKQPPSNPTKTAIDPKTIRTGNPRFGWLILITDRQIPPAVQTAACRPAAGRLRKNAWCRRSRRKR